MENRIISEEKNRVLLTEERMLGISQVNQDCEVCSASGATGRVHVKVEHGVGRVMGLCSDLD